MKLNENFWKNKYIEKQTQWDAGVITTPIKEYVDQLKDKNLKILIPGAGNGHEAEYLWNNGFKNIYVLDIVDDPLNNLKARVKDFSNENLILGDFFDLNETFDLIIEQTFFCALEPNLREKYASKMDEILNTNGRLVGVLFDFPLTEQGPPFGGDLQAYNTLFNPIFVVKKLEACYNSIKPRLGKEFFIILEKKHKNG